MVSDKISRSKESYMQQGSKKKPADSVHFIKGPMFAVVFLLTYHFTALLNFNDIFAKVNEQLLKQPQNSIFEPNNSHLGTL